MRMWVEKISQRKINAAEKSSSSWGCELKSISRAKQVWEQRHPLHEDVSWKTSFMRALISSACHPLHEDVSWKITTNTTLNHGGVILFMRMWVEKSIGMNCQDYGFGHPLHEDVSWKVTIYSPHCCLHSHPLHEDVSWKAISSAFTDAFTVILFMRMWVEKLQIV